jgi:hypothetical protein
MVAVVPPVVVWVFVFFGVMPPTVIVASPAPMFAAVTDRTNLPALFLLTLQAVTVGRF